MAAQEQQAELVVGERSVRPVAAGRAFGVGADEREEGVAEANEVAVLEDGLEVGVGQARRELVELGDRPRRRR